MKRTEKTDKQNFDNRIIYFQVFLLIFMACVIGRLFVVSVGQHSYYEVLANNQHSFFQQFVPNRGDIMISDRSSDVPYSVATNAVRNLIYVIPKNVVNPDATSEALASILGMNASDILPKLTDTSKQYVPLMHMLSDDQSSQISNAKMAGVYLSEESVRYYPEGNFLSQVLGFIGYTQTSTDKVGLYGLEKYFQTELAGTIGTISTDAGFSSDWIMGGKGFVAPANGSSLLLTVDRSIQYEAESVLKATVDQHQADSGNVIIENPKTGAILAMATYPSFDPNQYSKATTPSVYNNLATTENYEPGSTMKAITLGAALDQGLITPDSTYDDTGVVNIDGYAIKNSDFLGHGVVPMTQVIDHSLNTGAIYVENLLGNQTFLSYLKKFRFGEPSNIELPEAVGDLSNLNSNIQVNFDTASFGQGITVTPIQMLQAYDALANNGVMMQPYIVDSEVAPDGTVKKTEPKALGQIISAKAAQQMSGMLVDDVEHGYGTKAGVKGYYIGGKTGTAQVAENGSYKNLDNIGSFVGYGPIENPQFLMIVNINHPRDVNFAETTAAPAFGQIAQFILNYYQIPPTR